MDAAKGSKTDSAELTNFLKVVENLDQSSFPDDLERHRAIAATRALSRRLERPWDTLLRFTWSFPATLMSLRVADELGLFKALNENGGAPHTAADLGKRVGAQDKVVNRILRQLASNNLVKETAVETYQATNLTREISEGTGASAIDYLYWGGFKLALNLPKFLRETDYVEPSDITKGNWQEAVSPGQHFFQFLGSNAAAGKSFGQMMVGYNSDRESWVDVFPAETLMTSSSSSNDTILVDVGGNLGEDAARFVASHPAAAGRVVVQDQQHVLDAGTLPAGITPMAHDFFTPQPVKNARAYFMHSVLHDWGDENCIKILESLRPACGPDSRVLLCEHVLPPTGAEDHQTTLDVLMMAILSAKERSEPDFSELLSKAGFAIKKVHKGRLESVVEAVPV